MEPKQSLKLKNGAFGTPVMLNEMNVQYFSKGFEFKILGSLVNITDAGKINDAYNQNMAQAMFGTYFEIGYNLLNLFSESQQRCTIFSRYENIDMNYKLPENGIKNNFQNLVFVFSQKFFKNKMNINSITKKLIINKKISNFELNFLFKKIIDAEINENLISSINCLLYSLVTMTINLLLLARKSETP